MAPAPGWYGKLPALGDFASRRLRREFIEAWDAWLRQSMAASRARLGDLWLDAYLTCPIWRFALMPGVVDASAWSGVLMASVDKVGRHFPLTLALDLGARADPLRAVLDAQDWYAGLERAALSALEVDCTPENLEQTLCALPFPLPAAGEETPAVERLARWWQEPPGAPLSLDLQSVGTMREAVDAALRRVAAAGGEGRSFWWTQDQSTGLAQLHCVAGLPPDEYFPNLLQGGGYH